MKMSRRLIHVSVKRPTPKPKPTSKPKPTPKITIPLKPKPTLITLISAMYANRWDNARFTYLLAICSVTLYSMMLASLWYVGDFLEPD